MDRRVKSVGPAAALLAELERCSIVVDETTTGQLLVSPLSRLTEEQKVASPQE